MSVVYPNPFNLHDINGENGVVFFNNILDIQTGTSVASAGDINGDGWPDIVIGAPNSLDTRNCYVVFGHANPWPTFFDLTTLDGTNGFIFNSVSPGEVTGFSVAHAGDVNGDTIDDLIIGSNNANYGVYSGRVDIIFGKTTPWAPVFNLASLNGVNGFSIIGPQVCVQCGYSVSSAGDINGDGYSDIIFSSPYASPDGMTYAGFVVGFFGHGGAFSATYDIRTFNGTNGFMVKGLYSHDRFGSSVAKAGDINSDGISDIILGSAPSENTLGYAVLLFGKTSAWNAQINLASLDGNNGVIYNATQTLPGGIVLVASAGDVNGDSISDVIVGVNSYQFVENHIIFGRSSPWPARFSYHELDGIIGCKIIRPDDIPNYSANTGTLVASASDINQDGFGDLILYRDKYFNYGITNRDNLIIFGKQTWGPTHSIEDFNGQNGFAVTHGVQPTDIISAASTASDVNGDGVPDLLFGIPLGTTPDGTVQGGLAYLVFPKNIRYIAPNISSTYSSTGSITGSTYDSTGSYSGDTGSTAPYDSSTASFSSSESSTGGDSSASGGNNDTSRSSSTGRPFTSSATRTKPWFSGMFTSLSVNDYLGVVIPYVAHYVRKYSPFTLPWNRVRHLSPEEINKLEEYQNTVATIEETRRNQRTSRATRSGLFDDKTKFIEAHLKSLPDEISRILKCGMASTTQMSALAAKIEQVQAQIHSLARLNKSLKKIEVKINRKTQNKAKRDRNAETLVHVQHNLTQDTLELRTLETLGEKGSLNVLDIGKIPNITNFSNNSSNHLNKNCFNYLNEKGNLSKFNSTEPKPMLFSSGAANHRVASIHDAVGQGNGGVNMQFKKIEC